MNKSDVKLILIVALIAIISLIIINITKKEGKTAIVYYEDKKVLTIDLNNSGTYEVDGYLGKVVMEVNNQKIRVVEENSPKHLCSIEGYSNSKPIICLPNKIVIKITNNEIDGVVY